MPSNVHRLANRDTALKALYDDVSAKHMFPFWATSTDVDHDEVKQLLASAKAVPYLWRCAEDIEPILHRAVDLITMDDSERRSLVLVNPGDHAAAQAFAKCDPLRSERQRQLHRC
jgi:gentisate 1,2-dioxygenase